ncbi:hypothetical protein [Natronorubrum texcoconense]|uniref:DUF8027 domain-containing protein n=1 Tax=Natronorubrum texcoconense TaxID=1095776 RepID=A0A1G8UBD7_9EURY|nr:hypothetical protein [Natronorubrum texcoconense]SDJ50525.1 hypothetical protein SAMN04515672_0797 [Natronorubrum texcoconense]
MPIPGYDPEDIDEQLESRLDDGEIERKLTDSELEAYRDGDANLIDFLDEEEIEGILGR